MSLPLRHALENVTSPERVLEDLLVRFIINCPPEDLSSVERELFHFEEASWFYTDFVKLMNPSLPSFKIKAFAQLIIRLCPLVWKWDIKADQALQKFSKYKKTIPVRGAAIFNEKLSKILLVKGTESDSWSFPRGKISKDENDIDCCIREVKEETGFDLTDYVDESQFIERNIQGKNYKIFLVYGIPEDFDFKPHVRNEIEKIEWRDFKNITRTMHKTNVKYYLVNSMMRPLSLWVRRQKQIRNEDQSKKYAEEQLKLMLGITKEENIDPGRELLNMLQSSVHFSTNSTDSDEHNSNEGTDDSPRFDITETSTIPINNFQQQQQQSLPPSVFQGFPMPVNGSGYPSQFPILPPHLMNIPNQQRGVLPFINGPLPFMPSQFQHANIPQHSQPLVGSNPPAMFANINGKSQESQSNDLDNQAENSKELLNLLRSKPKEQGKPKETITAKPKIKILKRGENLSLNNHPQNDSNQMIDSLKNFKFEDSGNTQHGNNNSPGVFASNKHFDNNSNGASSHSDDDNLPDESSESIYEDFESSSEGTISSAESDECSEFEKSDVEEAELKKIGRDEEDNISSSESEVLKGNNFGVNNEIPSVIPNSESTRSVNESSSVTTQVAGPKPKVKILKRGEILNSPSPANTQFTGAHTQFNGANTQTNDIASNQGNPLLEMLKNPQNKGQRETLKADESFKGDHDDNYSSPLNSSGKNTDDSKALLDILKQPHSTKAESQANYSQFLSSPQLSHDSTDLLNLLKTSSQNIESNNSTNEPKNSNPLLDLLHRGQKSHESLSTQTATPVETLNSNNYPMNSQYQEQLSEHSLSLKGTHDTDANEELINMLRRNSVLNTSNMNSDSDFKNFSPINRDILATPVENKNQSSATLLNILHGRKEMNNASAEFSLDPSQHNNREPYENQTASHDLLNMLKSPTIGHTDAQKDSYMNPSTNSLPQHQQSGTPVNESASKNLLNILHRGL
ncbi:Nudix box signature [Nakaseomyces glabratus]|nr:Nudix box signature [Nakaseomyces glabratus]